MRNLAIILAIYLPAVDCLAETGFQSHESIYRSAKATLASKIPANTDYELELIPLDQQLQLPLCNQPLTAFIANEPVKAGRVSLGVRCEGERKWSIFMSAVIKVFADVLILKQPVLRGDLFTPMMLGIERRDVSRLREDYFTDVGQLADKQANRTLPAGSVLTLNVISPATIIKKGDKVVIKSARAGLAITMTGQALTAGYKGQVIRIKNLSSGRIISATVAEAGLVVVE